MGRSQDMTSSNLMSYVPLLLMVFVIIVGIFVIQYEIKQSQLNDAAYNNSPQGQAEIKQRADGYIVTLNSTDSLIFVVYSDWGFHNIQKNYIDNGWHLQNATFQGGAPYLSCFKFCTTNFSSLHDRVWITK